MKYPLNCLLSALIFVGLAPLQAQESFKSKNEANGLSVGDLAEDFTAIDHQGNEFSLYKALEDGPIVLLFYRGNWCPVCNRHLSKLEENLELIYQKGARVIAVSPEKPELMVKTIKKTKASFSLLYDEASHISEAFDVAYLPEKFVAKKFNPLSGLEESERLPIPATFIIDRSAKIVWRHFDPDYKNRASAKEIAQVLNQF